MCMRRMLKALMMIFICMSLYGCGASKKISIDYGDAESFEKALNNGENLEGKIVRFEVLDFKPNSALGYNAWAGEHLNFVSSTNPDIKTGDIPVVRVTKIISNMGSWVITYEKIDNAEITDDTIMSDKNNATSDPDDQESGDNSGSSTFGAKSSEKLPLEIKDYGWYINVPTSYEDKVYVNYCGMIYNPNESLVAEFPKVLVTVKNKDGSILSTEEHVGSIVMPKDTITLCGMFSMPSGDINDDTMIYFDVECSDFSGDNSIFQNVRTSDFKFENVSEHGAGKDISITGEITNTSDIDVESANVAVVLRKDGKIVYMENTFVDDLSAGKTKAFEISRYQELPEHDTIECSAISW